VRDLFDLLVNDYLSVHPEGILAKIAGVDDLSKCLSMRAKLDLLELSQTGDRGSPQNGENRELRGRIRQTIYDYDVVVDCSRKQLPSVINDNYFCRPTTTKTAGLPV
jgi:hypothetical protein